MKIVGLCALLFLSIANLTAQTFTQITVGDIVTTSATSRGAAWGDINWHDVPRSGVDRFRISGHVGIC